MKKTYILFLSTLLILFACINNKYKDFTQTPTGLYYRLLVMGEGNKPQKGEIITALITIFSRNKDTVFYSQKPITFLYQAKPYADEFISMLSEGDSAEFILNSEKFRNNSTGIDLKIPIDNEELLLQISIKKIRTTDAYEYEKIWEQEDPEMKERELLNLFLKENNIDGSQYFKSGIYVLPVSNATETDSVVVGSIVSIHIKGAFLNGKIFDSTYARNQPLEIVYGKPLQIIKGLEIALKGMKKGEKSKIIIPSQLAFGSVGSPEIIPPYTTLIYDLEIVNIKN
ncbi:MAG: FKBP-type peptidyl-prolyl cis-trans isomerase [Bacteroidetes bacterium]|nr:FKBP-type peptidyl-prolyl cis-trans isomerase [Bacteroidota bacterium]MBV6460255.1 hypothetical protein [Flavobacteriales bacterium]WKZ74623.1 MAG: FKBP-type peptidyl-prolyl cis-trans isomerase [Vicingaceae bacterium]MCL4816833.1 FKBP-type peptidyl-prolyl cis-trans isomerase [Flavobacteriales bacterium]NOG94930.1 FKBP-type peptidyl-prolyl cis-trans isomerase [Bacteroidota bacterium]